MWLQKRLFGRLRLKDKTWKWYFFLFYMSYLFMYQIVYWLLYVEMYIMTQLFGMVIAVGLTQITLDLLMKGPRLSQKTQSKWNRVRTKRYFVSNYERISNMSVWLQRNRYCDIFVNWLNLKLFPEVLTSLSCAQNERWSRYFDFSWGHELNIPNRS